ncbi:MAG TPA: hypothetical protein VF230_11150 [Acidimicrobiales bacterium]
MRRWVDDLRKRAASDDRGIGAVELVIAAMLMGIVGAVAIAGLISGLRLVEQSDDEATGLSDVRTIGERLSRDLRAARGIDDGATGSELSAWIDADSNYRRDAGETVTWKILALDDDQYVIERLDDAGGRTRVGSTLVDQIAFTYSNSTTPSLTGAAVVDAQVVTVQMTYDARPGQFAKERTTGYRIRLRNKE